ncbi:Lrp/AsnC family transcriptional regulator [Tsukamurella sp. 8F]|uniref:Lrp/AsnC family transcriptional regulator n=1 Tax=unclassified Tsukamurella TaxID=2633480 RepID=UPI0023B9D542|nr:MULTISPECIES: Lrp/AsnC family transcriptional regulator [unclassified Tsukamurella]MDF0531626.1 Lrp/AsnC family transcriptional regulator [Tsukamurella sp. 8J]MDF0588806.1 Lrp/AsnC family transcriptional regulator [Tsukamurella sp. 8F]
MERRHSEKSIVLDRLDRGILRALTYDARLSFAALADALSISEQTVKRRYDAMVRSGMARVFVMENMQVVGLPRWYLRLRPSPGEARHLADLLAAHQDISWVGEVSGGTEVVAIYRPQSESARDDLLRDRLPRTAAVAELQAHSLVFRYPCDRGMPGTHDALDEAQEARVRELADPAHRVVDLLDQPPAGATAPLDGIDRGIVAELERDGRTPYAAVARAVGISPARVSQRVAAMVRAGRLHFDLDLSMPALGYGQYMQLYLSCAPSAVDRAGRALARAEEVPFVGMATGPANLIASAVFRDDLHVHEFVTGTLGGIHGITSMELVPVTRPVKLARSFHAGAGLSPVPPARVTR